MSFNKLRVFHMVQYRKLVWMDSDTQVYQNIDHLMLEPTFTASYMQECMNGSEFKPVARELSRACLLQLSLPRTFSNADSGGKTAGSTWVVEPSWDEFNRIERLYSGPVPRTNPPTGWVFTDMQARARLRGIIRVLGVLYAPP